jgi:deazaflavin-dependent oxidoreductase (nitroreductase family)
MPNGGKLPRWLPFINRLVIALQRRGIAIGTMRLLSVPGRKTGKLRTTPVSPLTVGGQRYVVAGIDGADWVANARAAGWGILAQGRDAERVTLTELPVSERGAVLREFPRLVPHGVGMFRRVYEVLDDPATLPDAFAALAPSCPVFRIEPRPTALTHAVDDPTS